MISHERCRDQLGELLDQTLSTPEQGEVTSHLETCAECAQIAREMSRIRETLRDMAPQPAPPFLRHNVRAALEKEAQKRTKRPIFGWKMPPLAWSGTLAFAALALIVLARPFANAPLSLPEQALALQESVPQSPVKSAPGPQSAAAKKADLGVKEQKSAGSQKIKTSNPSGIGASIKRLAPTPPPPLKLLAPPRPGESRPTNSDLAPTRPIPTARPRPQAPSQPRAAAAPAPPSGVQSKAKKRAAPQFPAVSIQRDKAPVPLSPPTPQADAPQSNGARLRTNSRFEAKSAADSREQETPRLQQSDSTPPIFALELKAVPVAEPRNPMARSVPAPAAQPPAAQKETPQRASESTGSEPPAAGLRADALESRQRSLAAAAPSAADVGEPNGTQRFELSLKTSRAITGAQIRIEVPPTLRLVSPSSGIVWSGDFSPQKPIEISFSLELVQGGEKISVVMEQKSGEAPSRILETQTLVLPGGE